MTTNNNILAGKSKMDTPCKFNCACYCKRQLKDISCVVTCVYISFGNKKKPMCVPSFFFFDYFTVNTVRIQYNVIGDVVCSHV